MLQVEPLAAASEVLGAPQPLDGAPAGGAEGSVVNGPPAAAPPPAPAPAYGGGGGYGAPAPAYGAPAYGAPPAPAPAYGAQGPAAPAHGGGYGAGAGAPQANYGGGGGAVARNDSGMRYMDLLDLNPYANRWTVKVRVTSKGDIKPFTNAKGEGKLCNFDIMDHVRLPARCAGLRCAKPWLTRVLAVAAQQTGEQTRMVGFSDAVDKFYDMLHVGSVYTVTKGLLKPTNKARPGSESPAARWRLKRAHPGARARSLRQR